MRAMVSAGVHQLQHLMNKKKGKMIPIHAMEALGVRGGIASTHS
jgi:hypothetical protein